MRVGSCSWSTCNTSSKRARARVEGGVAEAGRPRSAASRACIRASGTEQGAGAPAGALAAA
eukprot:7361918-Prymnesium_polylepis.1